MSEKLPKGWKRVKLGDLIKSGYCEILNNQRKPLSKMQREKMKNGYLYPYYGAAGVIDYINEYIFDGLYLLVAEDGSVTSNGANPMIHIAKGKFWVSNHAHILRCKEEWQTKLLYYLLKNIDINSFITGAVQPKLSKSNLFLIEFLFPPLPEQKAIASVLSSLDDKIDLLHRQNQTLEQMAQTLFRKWFIEDAKEDWEEKPLDKIANFLNGLACQKYPPRNNIDKLPVLKIKELKNGFSENSDWATSDVPSEYIVVNGDVIFSWSGSLIVKIWDGEKCVLNQHLFKVTSEKYPKWFYYFWIKYYLQQFITIAESKATTMGHIKRDDLSKALVLVPPDEDLLKMDKEISPLIEKIIAINNQIRTLENMRDTLLPKLMSGEIKVKI